MQTIKQDLNETIDIRSELSAVETCLRLVLCTPSGAWQKRRRRIIWLICHTVGAEMTANSPCMYCVKCHDWCLC